MFSVSYNVSVTLKTTLAKIDNLYRDILLLPVSPKIEAHLRWQTTLARLEGWACLSNQPVSQSFIRDILGRVHTRTTSPLVGKVLSYKNATNHVRELWSGNIAKVTFSTIKELASELGVHYGSQEGIDSLLNYLQTGQIHPVIQAAIIHLYFFPSRLAYLSASLFLAKAGYDLRGWLSLEDYWNQNKTEYLQVIQRASTSTNTTLWLEYFCTAMAAQMTTIKTSLFSLISTPAPTVLKRLTVRQKEILALLEKPETPMTNKQVQELFKVSQITASRDLARLSIVGLLLPHGKGRATYYTRT